jgi:hypothetical protein
MADQNSSKADDGRGLPAGSEEQTAEPQPADPRLIPGGSFRSARTPIGVNAVDREDLPSGGQSIPATAPKGTPTPE